MTVHHFAACLLAIAVALAPGTSRAQALTTFKRSISNVEIFLPKLPGFIDPESVTTETQKTIENRFKGSRLVGFYQSQADPNRYVVVLARQNSKPISKPDDMVKFKAITKESVISAVRQDLSPSSSDADVKAEMKRRFDSEKIAFAKGSMLLTVLDDDPIALTLVVLQSAPGAQPIAQGMTQILLKGAWFSAFVTSPYKSKNDVDWVLSVTQSWLEDLKQANAQ